MATQIKAEELKGILLKEYPELQINISYNSEQDYKGDIMHKKLTITINCLNRDLYNRVKDFIIDNGWVILIVDKALSNSPFGIDLYERSHRIILKRIEGV